MNTYIELVSLTICLWYTVTVFTKVFRGAYISWRSFFVWSLSTALTILNFMGRI
jgi:hypothetical protein